MTSEPPGPVAPAPTRARFSIWIMRRAPRLLIPTVLSLCAISTAGAAVGPTKKLFDLSPDVAERSLKVFSQQSGREVLFATDTANGVKTNPVKGNFTPQEA